MHVFLVSNTQESGNLVLSKSYSKDGNVFSKVFSHNFGISNNTYGTQGYCLHGLYIIDLLLYNQPNTPQKTSFLFSYSGNQVNNLLYSSIWGCKLGTYCFGYCPSDTY